MGQGAVTPVETKVKAGTAAAAACGLAMWALSRYVFKGTVPDVIASWVYALVPAAVTFAAGYAAKHTPRPDAAAPIYRDAALTGYTPTTGPPEPATPPPAEMPHP